MNTALKLACITALCTVFVSCQKKQTVNEMLQNRNERSEIMTAICNDSALTAEMLNNMLSTSAGQQLMPQSCRVLRQVMASEALKRDTAVQNVLISGMMHLMQRDSVLCDKTCSRMNSNQKIARVLQQSRTQRVSPKR